MPGHLNRSFAEISLTASLIVLNPPLSPLEMVLNITEDLCTHNFWWKRILKFTRIPSKTGYHKIEPRHSSRVHVVDPRMGTKPRKGDSWRASCVLLPPSCCQSVHILTLNMYVHILTTTCLRASTAWPLLLRCLERLVAAVSVPSDCCCSR